MYVKGRANVVAPGWVATKMAEEAMQDENIRYQALATYVIIIILRRGQSSCCC